MEREGWEKKVKEGEAEKEKEDEGMLPRKSETKRDRERGPDALHLFLHGQSRLGSDGETRPGNYVKTFNSV